MAEKSKDKLMPEETDAMRVEEAYLVPRHHVIHTRQLGGAGRIAGVYMVTPRPGDVPRMCYQLMFQDGTVAYEPVQHAKSRADHRGVRAMLRLEDLAPSVVGHALRIIREIRGMRLEEVAACIGRTASNISTIERGVTTRGKERALCPAEIARMMVKAMDVSEWVLLIVAKSLTCNAAIAAPWEMVGAWNELFSNVETGGSDGG